MKATKAGTGWINDLYLVSIMVAVFILDQFSKLLIRINITEGFSVPSEGFFRFTHVTNSGSAFGFFPSQTVTLTIASLAGIGILIFFYRHQPIRTRWLYTSLGLQLGGAAGNLVDRITLGEVTDFIDVGPWPMFNIADASIVTGLAVLVWVFWFRKNESDLTKKPEQKESSSSDELFTQLVSDSANERLDSFVSRMRPDISRSRIQRLIRENRILVNNKPTKVAGRLQLSDEVQITLPSDKSPYPIPEYMPINILYEDNDVLVVDKPPGLSVHPSPGHPKGTLVNALLAHYPNLENVGDKLRPGIVHRLDANTSGVLVVARTDKAHRDITKQFKERSTRKTYIAVVLGYPNPSEGIIEAPIGRSTRNRTRMEISGSGREATTHYRTLQHYKGYTMLEIKPETGRTHQIRVHLSSIGHPIAGDLIYGGKSTLLSRQFLHASTLEIKLPSSGILAEFSSPLPSDLAAVLAKLESVLD
jgi:23S rRNA pseudouridine1911/1915/1917 synthase